MKKQTKKAEKVLRNIFCLIITIAFVQGTKAQEISKSAVSAGGGGFVSYTLSLDFVIGEIAVETSSGTTAMLTQGFLQGDESHIGIHENSAPDSGIKIYPNPANGYIYIYCKNGTQPETVSVKDICGKTLLRRRFLSNPQKINITGIKKGFYTVEITFENGKTSSKKIIVN